MPVVVSYRLYLFPLGGYVTVPFPKAGVCVCYIYIIDDRVYVMGECILGVSVCYMGVYIMCVCYVCAYIVFYSDFLLHWHLLGVSIP